MFITKLLRKKRKEILLIDSKRISYSNTDILLEDCIEKESHHYVVYDLNKNIIETNMSYSEDCKPMWSLYLKSLFLVKEMLGVGYK